VPDEISASYVKFSTPHFSRGRLVKFQFTVQFDESKFDTVEVFDHALSAVSQDLASAQKEICSIRTSNRS
jgi:hypothetical protein